MFWRSTNPRSKNSNSNIDLLGISANKYDTQYPIFRNSVNETLQIIDSSNKVQIMQTLVSYCL